jgi:hypothetical protein
MTKVTKIPLDARVLKCKLCIRICLSEDDAWYHLIYDHHIDTPEKFREGAQ